MGKDIFPHQRFPPKDRRLPEDTVFHPKCSSPTGILSVDIQQLLFICEHWSLWCVLWVIKPTLKLSIKYSRRFGLFYFPIDIFTLPLISTWFYFSSACPPLFRFFLCVDLFCSSVYATQQHPLVLKVRKLTEFKQVFSFFLKKKVQVLALFY